MVGDRVGVLIVDDHVVVAQAFAALLDREDDLDLVGMAASVDDALHLVQQQQPDVVVVDYRLGDGSGLDAARQIRTLRPATGLVMVSALKDPDLVSAALAAGCCGFVPKDADAADLVRAIRAAAKGETYLAGDIRQLLADVPIGTTAAFELTGRERQVLQLTADGASVEEIAVRLFLSAHTVRNHLRHAMTRLGVHTKLEAVMVAARVGVVRLEGSDTP